MSDHFVNSSEPKIEDYDRTSIIDPYMPKKKDKKPRISEETIIDLENIHWRNTPLLAKFMTSGGRIMHRTRTGLSIKAQKKLAKTINHARNLNLLPSATNLKPFNRIPLRNVIEDIQDDLSYKMDFETGAISRK